MGDQFPKIRQVIQEIGKTGKSLQFKLSLEKLNPYQLAYVYLMEPNDTDPAARNVIDPVLPCF